MSTLSDLDATMIRQHNEHPHLGRHRDPNQRSYMHDRHAATQPLFTSPLQHCLTHIVRFVTIRPLSERVNAQAMCGTTQHSPVWVEPRFETFVCRRCHAVAKHYGVETFGLIPDSGCAVSGGRRGRNARPETVK